MFRIEYKIISDYSGEIDEMTDEEIQYNFLLGNVSLISSDVAIDMEWEWLPLLDFAYCLKSIVSNLATKDSAKEDFEFTENVETLEFSRQREQLKIVASFSSTIIATTFTDFEKAVYDFHFSVSEYIRKNISSDPPSILQKYLSVEV